MEIFPCIQSLVLEVNSLKQGCIFKNRPFYISFILFNTFPSRSEYSKKETFKKNSILPSYPIFFSTHIFFIWPEWSHQQASKVYLSLCWYAD